MADDLITETVTTGWGGRIVRSLLGALIGLALVVGSLWLLWWNEGRAVDAARALDRGARSVISVTPDNPGAAPDGSLVHVIGHAASPGPLRDTMFAVQRDDALRLRRVVEMYQWHEDKKTETTRDLGGKETQTTVYSYRMAWSDQPQDSTKFQQRRGHGNPSMPARGALIEAGDARIGAIKLTNAVLSGLDSFQPMAHPVPTPRNFREADDWLYRGADPLAPAVGDLRVRYEIVPAQTVSVVAQMRIGILTPYRDQNGYEISLIKPGTETAAKMFGAAREEEALTTWILRGVGFVMALVGFWLMYGPLSAIFAVVPFLEDMVGIGTFFLALPCALFASATTIAIAWFAHRPILTGVLIACGAGAAIAATWSRRSARRPLPVRT